ncbi:MAG: hypothetical protein K2M30_01835, partial [Desulfovibrionaceae bacterium]|nr:hypothetical protein [Desulfovibrionaceae bacterium]
VHEHCTPYTGVEFIERLRLEYNCTSPIILILSSPPSVSLMQTLESLSSVALVRPYTRKDVQRALVQSKRVITECGTLEEMYYKRIEEGMNNNEEVDQNFPIEESKTFLVSMIQFQFFLRSGEYEKAVDRLLILRESMSINRIISLVERTSQEVSNKVECLDTLCHAVARRDKALSDAIGNVLLEGHEQKLTIKKLSERKARVIAQGSVANTWKNLQ